MILQAFFLAIAQIGDRPFRKVLMLGVLLTFALLVAATVGLLWLVQTYFGDGITLPWIGEVQWVDSLFSATSILVMLFLSIFLMVPVASAITSFFLDEIAQAVEDRHYPQLPEARNVPFAEALSDSVAFLGVLIVANLLGLIVYLIFLVTAVLAPFAPFVFYALNGYLLGREYFTLVAIRRIGRKEATRMRKKYGSTVFLAGVLMTVPLTVPVVNLLVPVLGAATFTHLFQMLNKER
ncbi:EI24 domain-containing protein [Phaeobacter sp. 22II1-1F12B]|uniref:EI24 domain-containing protein n=1 Tax=Phaeobacter sp. 22II1-1F12B TaxID=1317111 RepID=UPI000B524357|nr:EI24 domain-containing protein [Phaeobacter sp. 22II1-1F12B]OWU76291.1 membrane protein [Phaeobacter sp. 22II1-1F12B]